MTDASAAQHGIWFTEEAGLAGTAFHMALEVWFDGDLDLDAMRTACERVVARHPALGSAFTGGDGVLRVVPGERPPITVTALTSTLVAEELARPFDLARGPLARFTIAAASPARHLLLVTAHHLVFDGISKAVLVADLAAAYNGVPLEPLASGRAAPIDLDAAREFWRDRWSGPGPVSLPGLRHVPERAEPAAAITWGLGPELSRGIGTAAGAAGVTRFELLLTGVLTLLHRYADPHPTVSIDVSTRTPATADHIGHFVNELPVAVPVPAAATFAGYAAAVRAAVRESYRHRAAPVARVVSGLRPTPALTPVSVSYRRHAGETKFTGLDAAMTWLMPPGAARNALHLQILDEGTDLQLSLQFAPSAIGANSVRRIAGHLEVLLSAALADPAIAIADLPLLTGGERDLLATVNATEVAYPANTVDELFAASARATPDAIAIVSDGRQLTYTELSTRVADAAHGLAEQGAGPGSLVGICLPRSAELVVAILAAMRCGAAYLPLDVSHPEPRQAMILGDARPLLIVETALTGEPACPGVRSQAVPDGLAYVMYTSGSTGRPKGVQVTQANLVNLLLAMRDALGSGPADTWLGLTSPAFDISGLELLLPLITGGRLVIAPPELSRDAVTLHRLIREQGVTHIQATPSGWQLLLEGGRPALRVALAGGEALPPALAAELRECADRVVNVYGPTETTIWSTMDDAGTGDVTIGRPIANTQAYVLDESLRVVPMELPGELYLGGAGVARGYLGRPDLDQERFVPDPAGPPGARLYRTGDLARWRPDGRLEFLGRLDGQVKVRGHRVELGEIETRLLDHPAVAQAAVALRDDDGQSRLVAYLVGGAVTPEELRVHVAATLPGAMVPTAYVLLDRLPLTPNGKLDRAALPAPPAPQSRAADEADDAGGVAADLREIWQEVLEIDGIGLDEDIFDLGGHSLLIVKIISRIRRQLGVDVPIEVFVDTPTIRGLADAITDYHRSAS